MKTRVFIVIGLLMVSLTSTYSQVIKFQKKYGGMGTSVAKLEKVVLNQNGTYSFVGSELSTSTNNNSVMVWNADKWGISQIGDWKRYYTTLPSSYQEIGRGNTTDLVNGGRVVAGTTDYSGNLDIIVFGVDGSPMQPIKIGGPGNEIAYCIEQTADYGWILCGYTTGYGATDVDAFLVKIASNGTISWKKKYGFANSTDELFSIKQTADGGYIGVGRKSSPCFSGQATDILLMKFTSTGTVTWSKCLSHNSTQNVSPNPEAGYDLIQTSDGGYAITGTLHKGQLTGGFDVDMFLLKCTSSGAVSFMKHFDLSLGWEVGKGIKQTSDGGYIICGMGESASNPKAVLLKLTSVGALTWSRTYDGGVGLDCFNDVEQTTDNGYIACGVSGNGAYVVRTNSIGESGCNESAVTPTITNHTPLSSGLSTSIYDISEDVPTNFVIESVHCSSGDEYVLCQMCPVDAGPNQYNSCYLNGCPNPGGTTVIIGTSSFGWSYNWTPAPVGTGACQTCAVTPTAPCNTTTYTLTVTGSGCTANSDVVTVFTTPIACGPGGGEGRIASQDVETTFSFTPNPSNGSMLLLYSVESDAQLYLTDLSGKTICSYFLPKEHTNYLINCDELNEGLYMYRIISNGDVLKSGKLIIMK